MSDEVVGSAFLLTFEVSKRIILNAEPMADAPEWVEGLRRDFHDVGTSVNNLRRDVGTSVNNLRRDLNNLRRHFDSQLLQLNFESVFTIFHSCPTVHEERPRNCGF